MWAFVSQLVSASIYKKTTQQLISQIELLEKVLLEIFLTK